MSQKCSPVVWFLPAFWVLKAWRMGISSPFSRVNSDGTVPPPEKLIWLAGKSTMNEDSRCISYQKSEIFQMSCYFSGGVRVKIRVWFVFFQEKLFPKLGCIRDGTPFPGCLARKWRSNVSRHPWWLRREASWCPQRLGRYWHHCLPHCHRHCPETRKRRGGIEADWV